MASQQIAEPWERQPRETAKAYEAFAAYRDYGAERSCLKVSQKLSKSLTLIKRWSRDWNWVERSHAWDNDLAEAARKKARKEVEEMQRRHVELGRLLQDKAIAALQSSGYISPKHAAALAKLGVDVERLARGEATERVESKNEISGAVAISDPLDGLTEDELRRLLAAAEAAATESDG